MRNTVQEVGGAIERINNPARLTLFTLNLPAFFEQEAPIGPRMEQLVIEYPFGLLIRLRNEICGALFGDLQMLDLAKVAAQAATRLARRAVHYLHQACFCWHRFSPLSSHIPGHTRQR